MFLKKLYKLKSMRKLCKFFGIIGLILFLSSIYFLLQPNSINQSFIIGTAGLLFLFISFYAYYKEKKEGKLSLYKFFTVFNTGSSLLFLLWAVFAYCQHYFYGGTLFLVCSIILAIVVYLKKYVNKLGEDNVIKLIEKYDKN